MIFNHTMQTVALGAGLLGFVSGAMGSFAVLRRRSLLGDAISHAALPGIAVAFLLTGTKSVGPLLAGAAAAGIIGTFIVSGIVNTSRVKDDTALGIVLSVFFGFGIVLLTYIQKLPNSAQAGLDKFLFGQAAALLNRDIYVIGGAGVLLLVGLMLFWKEFKLLSFDPDFGASLGFPMRVIDGLMIVLLVVGIVLGLQTVGVVLMSAMVVAPAAAARQWTDRLGLMVFLAAVFGAVSGVAGAVISSSIEKMPTGPTIVLCVSFIVVASLLFAPNRGMLSNLLKSKRNRHKLLVDTVLADLYALSLQHPGGPHAHSVASITAMNIGRGGVEDSLNVLAMRGWAKQSPQGGWMLTPEGADEAQKLGVVEVARR